MRVLGKAVDGSMVPWPPDRLDEAIAASDWVWIDLDEISLDQVDAVAGRFGFDRVAVEDVLEETEFPKVDDLGDHLFVVLHGISGDVDRLNTIEVDAFVTAEALVTAHRRPAPGLDWIYDESQRLAARAEGGPARMLARIAAASSRRFLPLIAALDERIDELEDAALAGDPQVLGEVQALRRDLTLLRRLIGPQREVLRDLANSVSPLIDETTSRRFDDVYDHHYRIVESIDTARSLTAALLDLYRGTVAESMNDVMKVLTVFSAILLPLSLMTGIYGMNFAHMPELQWRYGYFALLGVMAVVAVGLWFYFARRGFIGGPRLSTVPRVVGKGLSGLVHVTLSPVRVLGEGMLRLTEEATTPPHDDTPSDGLPPADR